MSRTKLTAVIAGLMLGQLFADGGEDRLFKVSNTVRVGYSDNLHRTPDGKGSSFVTDTIDLSFRAAFSDRTDLMIKSQLNLLEDDGGSEMYPNLYAMLSHSVSPRLLMRLSEYYRSGEKSGGDANRPGKNTRYNYFFNKVDVSADYVLTGKDRLNSSFNYSILQHDKDLENNDYTAVEGGLSWSRELMPQRTSASLNLRQRRVVYDNQPQDTATRTHLDDEAYYDATDLSAGLSHTFNPQWHGTLEAGVTRVQPHFSDANDTDPKFAPTFFDAAANDPTLSPLVKAGLTYTPSPRTRLSGDFSMSHSPSDDDGYGGQNTAEFIFGVQHDITAKLMAKATARFSTVSYDEQEATTGASTDQEEDRTDLEFALTYKLNRMHFIEARVQHRETEYSDGDDGWEENRVDIGWRVELN
jgi:hypothetical protein